MFIALSQRLLTLLQLTRMALVFTAMADSLCSLALWAQWHAERTNTTLLSNLPPLRIAAVAAICTSKIRIAHADLEERRAGLTHIAAP